MLPLKEAEARALRAGDEVLVEGRLITAREAAHRYLVQHDDRRLRRLVAGSLVYHCGPVVARDPRTRRWTFVAAGPSASIREEPYQARVIAAYGLRGVIGTGGMGPATLAALREHGAVYLHTTGTLAVALARHVVDVEDVRLLDSLGLAEAIWVIRVRDFPAVVTMDSHGDTLHRPATPAQRRLERPRSLHS